MGAASVVAQAVGSLVLLGALDDNDDSKGKPKQAVRRPEHLYQCFDHSEVGSWDKSRFKKMRALMDAPRNYGRVYLMTDTHTKDLVAVKKMPTKWVCSCHSEFVAAHPRETEQPWQDFGCARYLAAMGYSGLLHLRGVYRDKKNSPTQFPTSPLKVTCVLGGIPRHTFPVLRPKWRFGHWRFGSAGLCVTCTILALFTVTCR